MRLRLRSGLLCDDAPTPLESLKTLFEADARGEQKVCDLKRLMNRRGYGSSGPVSIAQIRHASR